VPVASPVAAAGQATELVAPSVAAAGQPAETRKKQIDAAKKAVREAKAERDNRKAGKLPWPLKRKVTEKKMTEEEAMRQAQEESDARLEKAEQHLTQLQLELKTWKTIVSIKDDTVQIREDTRQLAGIKETIDAMKQDQDNMKATQQEIKETLDGKPKMPTPGTDLQQSLLCDRIVQRVHTNKCMFKAAALKAGKTDAVEVEESFTNKTALDQKQQDELRAAQHAAQRATKAVQLHKKDIGVAKADKTLRGAESKYSQAWLEKAEKDLKSEQQHKKQCDEQVKALKRKLAVKPKAVRQDPETAEASQKLQEVQEALTQAKVDQKTGKELLGKFRNRLKEVKDEVPPEPEGQDETEDEARVHAIAEWQDKVENFEVIVSAVQQVTNKMDLQIKLVESAKVELEMFKQKLDHKAVNKKQEAKRRKVADSLAVKIADSLAAATADDQTPVADTADAQTPAADTADAQTPAADTADDQTPVADDDGAFDYEKIIKHVWDLRLVVMAINRQATWDGVADESIQDAKADIVKVCKQVPGETAESSSGSSAKKQKVVIPPGVGKNDQAAFRKAATDAAQERLA
jgi:hypothetical protein